MLQRLIRNSVPSEPTAEPEKSTNGVRMGRATLIPDQGISTATRLRKVFEKLAFLQSMFADGRASAIRMQSELDQLQRDKVLLRASLDELSRKEVEVTHRAFHDELTGLPNRSLLRDRFSQVTALSARRQRQVVLLFLDLDNFKHVNDDFGHVIGDKVLQDVAARLQSTIRAEDTACRYGGDEFVILIPDIDPATGAADVSTKICHRLAAHYQIGDVDVDLRASIGIAIYPDDGRRLEDLVHHADSAMYRARSQQRGTVRAASMQGM